MFEGQNVLLLTPTSIERDELVKRLGTLLQAQGWALELCGFGAIASAAATSRAIAKHSPDAVILLGIAGTFNERAPVGSAHWFSDVVCDGIGIGEANSFQSASILGWSQWQTDAHPMTIGDWLPLTNPSGGTGVLVSGCAASADSDMATRRLKQVTDLLPQDRFRDDTPIAEDMEGFAVSVACCLASVPLFVLRGISNRVGDRDHARWQIAEALGAVAERLVGVVNKSD